MDEEVVGDGNHGQHVHAEEDAAESAHHRHVEHVHIHVSAHGANTLKIFVCEADLEILMLSVS